ncbi:uncharacterized protein F5Z01DRAFT_691404 [Emericellopsis atlantica]|uniref:Fe2OG dioxygenase domain-containing protein n=1 Tax=Emericellopsis atlantica TaxID=2614577 RepID=A0A9P7ZHP6_9HYPO|nr:uncharacterized protein F5Z01DRAFT_691404 [Emericellopsis atlantica]KAG9251867.1 hypothetical protein F5Z01DRAFT_691404 [Emericellopsis atlantica]
MATKIESKSSPHAATPAAPFNVRRALLDAFDGITAPGSFAGSARITDTPPVDVHVHGVGPISMPLTEDKARQIISVCHQAPYGKGSETLVDTAVRNTWELDPTQFELKHPSWPGFLSKILVEVGKILGINQPIKAELYKMLIYSQGAMFKPHTDTEKIPGMFGTLIVSLPSPHTGGEVIVKHGGKEYSYKTSEMAQSLITWYSDVIHEVRPVTSGHRWVLTYNLALAEEPSSETPLPSAGLIQDGIAPAAQRLRETITRWLDATQTPGTYTTSLTTITPRPSACEDLPVDLFLALLEKEELGSVEFHGHDRRRRRYYDDEPEELDDGAGPHKLQDIFDTQYRVKSLFDFDGTLVSERLGLSNNDLTTPDIWYDVHDCEEAYEGYMGNSGPSAIHWYRISAIAIVPRDSLVAYFLNYDLCRDDARNMNLRIGYFARSVLRGGASASTLDALMDFCYDAWSRAPALSRSYMMPQLTQLDGDVISTVFKVALQHDRRSFFLSAVDSVKGDLAPEFFDWVRQWLGTGNDASSRFEHITMELKTMIESYPRFASRHAAITKLVGDPTVAPPAILAWARETLAMFIYKAWTSPDGVPVDANDGKAVADSISMFENPPEVLTAKMKRFAMPTARIMAFVLTFMARLNELRVAGTLPEAESVELYAKLADRMVNQSDTFTALKSRRQATTKQIGMDTIIDPEDMARLFSGAVAASKFNWSRHVASSIVAKITREAPFYPPIELYGLWIPMLALLPPILQAEGIPAKDPPYQQLYQTLMVAAADRFDGQPPTTSNDLRRPAVNCSCPDCHHLNAFLASPTRETGKFPMNKNRRAHVHQQLDRARIDCTHVMERFGTPQTLVVQKTSRHHAENHKIWVQKIGMLARLFDRIQTATCLRDILLDQYDDIAKMHRLVSKHIKSSHQPPPATPGSAGPSSAANPAPMPSGSRTAQPMTPSRPATVNYTTPAGSQIAGTKRKMHPTTEDEVVDLLND